MGVILILFFAGAFCALLSTCAYLAARWLELNSTSGELEPLVLIVRGTALGFGILGTIGLCNINLLATSLVFTAWFLHWRGRRRVEQDTLVWIMAIATSHRMPLAPCLAAYAAECRGGQRWRLLRIAHRLNAGESLSEAFRSDNRGIWRSLSTDGAAAVSVGGICGDLAGTLRDAARAATSRRTIWHEVAMRSAYIGQTILVTLIVVGWTFYFVIPRFVVIFDDFAVDLPPVTQTVFGMVEFVFEYAIVLLPLALLAAGGVVLTAKLLASDIPGITAWLRRRHGSALLRALAGVLERGQPLAPAVSALAEDYPSAGWRQRLRRVAGDLSAGAVGWNAFVERGLLGRLEAAVLESAERVGNLPWAMRALADSSDRRAGYRVQVWLNLLWPLAVVVVGSLVGFVVLGVLWPMVELIEKASQ